MDKDEIVFKISKIKAVSLTLIAVGLLIVLIWFLVRVLALPLAFNRTFLLICCSSLIGTFILASISGIRKLFDSKQRVVINNEGIKIDTGPNKGQLISWDEITGFKIRKDFLLIFIKNPNKLFDEAYGLQKFSLKMNNISHKTPVSLTATWLDCSFETLVKTIIQEFCNRQQHSN